MTEEKLDLKRAYGLKTPEDSVALYRDWAETYDKDFAELMDYQAPKDIAKTFAQYACDSDDPILDVGAGTGLVGAALAELGKSHIDGLDISHEMLKVANDKGCYRGVIQANLTAPLDIPDAAYGGIISAGTFTHGHVGPDALDELLRVARPGALFVLGVNAEAYTTYKFDLKFAALAPQLRDFQLLQQKTYGENGQPERQNDLAQVAVFRKK